MTVTVAVIGGGTSGICAARNCLREGLSPTLFEATGDLGGHWSASDPKVTAVFDNLLANIAFYETAPTDILPLREGPNLEHGTDASMFLNSAEWNRLIKHIVAITPGLADCIHLNARVTAVRRVGAAYAVSVERDGVLERQEFDKVMIATGAMQVPRHSLVRNLDKFRGRVMHSKEYRNPAQFQGQTVLIVGGSVSGAECAGDLCATPKNEGPTTVLFLMRKMKHFVAKQRDETTYTFVQHNNLASLRLRSGVTDLVSEHERLRPKFEEFSRNSDVGLPPHTPGTVLYPASSRFLKAVKARDKLAWRIGEIAEILDDGAVKFNDGEVQRFDAILFSTGYDLQLPMLEKELRDSIVATKEQRFRERPELNLYLETWHHDLPGCAFIGLYGIIGSVFAMVDMQTRWVARAFADEAFMPGEEEVREGVRESIAARKRKGYLFIRFLTPYLYIFAKKVGCEIDYAQYPELTKCLLAGPFVPMQFRLCGYGAVEDPVTAYKQAVRRTGVSVDSIEVTHEDLAMLKECLNAFEKLGDVPLGFAKALALVERELNEM